MGGITSELGLPESARAWCRGHVKYTLHLGQHIVGLLTGMANSPPGFLG